MKVLLAYDGRERSKGILDEAARMGEAVDRTVLLAVVSPGETATRGDVAEEQTAGTTWEAHPVEAALAEAQAHLRDHGVEADAQLRFGDPVDVVADELARGGYDLLLVGTRLQGTLAEMLLGDVSRRLVERAPCPVLVVGEEWTVRVDRRAPLHAEAGHVRLTSVGGMPA